MLYSIIYYNSKIPLGCFELKIDDLVNHELDHCLDLEKFNYRMKPNKHNEALLCNTRNYSYMSE